MPKVTIWECPKCGTRRRERFAKQVFHNCPTSNAETFFKKLETVEE